jgi:Zn-dependent peptidase ImmA (M78 family)
MREAIGENLRVFRKRSGMNQVELAEAVGLSRVSISNYESGKTLPNSTNLSELAAVLGVPLEALLRRTATGGSFRFRSDTSFKNDVGTAARVQMWSEDYAHLEKVCEQVPYAPESVPCYDLNRNRELLKDVAAKFRRRCGLGDEEPVANLFATVERLGLKCIRRPIDKKGLYGVTAYSDEHGGFVFVNTFGINIERQIFTLAHELGHLILHRPDFKKELGEPDKRNQEETEDVAHWFAGNFLVPDPAIRWVGELDSPGLETIMRLKRDYRVSYMTFLRRLSEVANNDYGEHIKRFRGAYRKRYGKSLGTTDEPLQLLQEEFPENQRYEALVRKALIQGKISTSRAAELVGLPLVEMRAKIREWKRQNGS